ncbi:MAG: hypothetical protein RL095_2222 [Verrucomicrobiota bacterium]|jgi:hypothetical protein
MQYPTRRNFATGYLRFLCLLLPLQLLFCLWVGIFKELPLVQRLPAPVATGADAGQYAAIYHYVEAEYLAQKKVFDEAWRQREAHQRLIVLVLAALGLVLLGIFRPNPMTAPGLIIACFLLMVAISINSNYQLLSLVLNACFFLPALSSALHFRRVETSRIEQAAAAESEPS